MTAGGSEISRRSLTGRVCVREREKWRVLCNVNAARGGRGPQTAASTLGPAQEQIASAATSPRLCFWAEPGHLGSPFRARRSPPPRPRNWRFPTRANVSAREVRAAIILNPGTRPRESFLCRLVERMPGSTCVEPRPTPGSQRSNSARRRYSTSRGLVSPLVQAHSGQLTLEIVHLWCEVSKRRSRFSRAAASEFDSISFGWPRRRWCRRSRGSGFGALIRWVMLAQFRSLGARRALNCCWGDDKRD